MILIERKLESDEGLKIDLIFDMDWIGLYDLTELKDVYLEIEEAYEVSNGANEIGLLLGLFKISFGISSCSGSRIFYIFLFAPTSSKS